VPEHFRDQAMAELQERKIGVAINFRAIHLLTYYRETFGFKPQTYPIAEKIGNRTISIPFFPSMSDREVERVIEVVEEVAKLW
jgi:UDP-4-amino-4-deoxy-L-arabinose-oxoglutarate aminotransferase